MADGRQLTPSMREDSMFSTRSSLREREVFRLLEPWQRQSSRLFQPVSISKAAERATALGCDDTALSAFAQLGAFRLNVDRCMIILFGKEHEYLLAESTRTLSLQSDAVHSHGDALWIGTASYASSEGLSKLVLPAWNARPTPRSRADLDHYHTQGQTSDYLLINDMRQHESHRCVFPEFNSLIRFMAAVPLRSSRGHVVGAYVVIDTIPRYGISEAELVFLEDMGKTTINHLDAVRASAQKQNAERLIKGLGVFTQGGSSLRGWWYEQWDAKQDRSRRQDEKGARREASRERIANEEMGDDWTPGTDEDCHLGLEASLEPQADGPLPGNTHTRDFAEGERLSDETLEEKKPANHRASSKKFDLQSATAEVFARASNLIREAMNVDGVLFLDAGFTRNDSRAKSDARRMSVADDSASYSSTTSDTHASDLTATNMSNASDSASPVREPPPKSRRRRSGVSPYCTPLGYCTRTKFSLRNDEVPQKFKTFPQSRMEKLAKRYPFGKIFSFSESGSLETSSGADESRQCHDSVERETSSVPTPRARKSRTETDAMSLVSLCDGARSVAFFPLWDAHREKWRSGVFVWTTVEGKYMSREEDLAYLLAFADSIAGVMTRLDMMASDQAKTTFISTISHELRSPLHGVLAGSEYLLTTQLNSTQHEMATTIKTAAGTLLDTINAILDFTRINTHISDNRRTTRAGGHKNRISFVRSTSDPDSAVTGLDLAVLTEDVVNTIVAGYQRRDSDLALGPDSWASPFQSRDVNSVEVILDMSPRAHWGVLMDPGTWTRILTNLVGNALKYTVDGYVHVKLSHGQGNILLSIQDSGSGISKDFQAHHLFTAFKQENPLASGTGLGLFIANKLVADLGGDIVIESGRGNEWGTKLLIKLPEADICAEQTDVPSDPATRVEAVSKQILLLTRSPLWTKSKHDRNASTKTGMLKSGLRRVCEKWLDTSLHNIESIEDADATDICLVLEGEFWPWWEAIGKDYSSRSQLPTMLVLAEKHGRTTRQTKLGKAHGRIKFIDPPFGPRKLSRALNRAWRGESDTSSDESGDSAIQSGEEQRPEPPPVMVIKAPSSPKKALLVEDNDLNMKLLAAWCKKLGLQFVKAVNGLEAVNAYMADPTSFDLVLMDISMPVMDGFTATSEIRAFENRQRLRRCKIVALTGVASEDARENAIKVGLDDFLVKPASLAKIGDLFD